MTKSSVIFLRTLTIFSALPAILQAISSVHHDKPEEVQLTKMAIKMRSNVTNHRVPLNVTILNSERQKRLLLPYMNYYNYQKAPSENSAHRNSEPKEFTPFLKSNALTGPFIPMNIRNVDYEEAPPPPPPPPNYSTIYDKLSRLKLVQHIQPTRFQKPQVYIGTPFKASVDTYTPTTIDVPQAPPREEYKPRKPIVYKIFRAKPAPQYITLEVAQQYQPQQEYYKEKEPPKPFVYYPQKPVVYEEHTLQKPYTTTTRPIVNTIVDDEYVAQKFTQVPPQHVPKTYHHKYEPVYFPTTPLPASQDNSNVLQQILNELQRTNTLPSSLTPSNIDNSIRTLVKILDALKKQQKFTKPIVVAEENSAEEIPELQHHPVAQVPEVHHHPVTAIPDVQHHQHHHHQLPVEVIQEVPAVEFVPQPIEEHEQSYSQSFPANTVEGGTPGRPGIDYPALSTIPQTSFNCKTQRYKGFFGDPHTNCQVWHYCDLNGGQASFLCPNGTIFSQVALTCDWWYNVKCSSTAQLYVLNERLYKYILPLSPKFPEDYSGPLVDKYLALKFKEMEEKMRKQKNRKQDSGEDDDEEEAAEDSESDNATTEKSQSEQT